MKLSKASPLSARPRQLFRGPMPVSGNLPRRKHYRRSQRPVLLGQRLGTDLFGRALRLGVAGLVLTGMTAGAKMIWREYQKNKPSRAAAANSHLPWPAQAGADTARTVSAQANGPAPDNGRSRVIAVPAALDNLLGTSTAGAAQPRQTAYAAPVRVTCTIPAASSPGAFVPGPVANVPAVSRRRSVAAAPASSIGTSALISPVPTATGSFTWLGGASSGGGPNWTTPANWTTGVAPAPTANADISYTFQPASAAATNVNTSYTINSLTFQGTSGGAAADTPSYNLTGSTGATLTINGGGITDASAKLQTLSLPIALGANQSWTVSNSAGNLTVAGVVSGTGSLTKLGAGTLSLSGANTFTGNTTLSAGTLDLSNTSGSALGSGTLYINGGAISNNAVESGTPFVENVFVSNAVVVSSSFVFGPHNDGGLVFTGQMSLQTTPTITASANQVEPGGGFFFAGHITGTAGAGLTFQNTGVIYFENNAPNTYTGPTTVAGAGSRLYLTSTAGVSVPGDLLVKNNGYVASNGGQFAATTNVTITTGGQYALGGASETMATLNGDTSAVVSFSSNVTSGFALKVGGGTFAGTMTSYTPPEGYTPAQLAMPALIKTGTGTLTLLGNNTYARGTEVSAGTLLVNNVPVNGVGSGTSTGFVQVDNGARLGGLGQIAGPVTVGAAGKGIAAVLEPGDNVPGVLTLESSLTLANSAQLDITLGGLNVGADGHSQLLVAGVLTLGGNLNVTLANGFKPAYGQTFYIIDDTGSAPVTGSFLNVSGGRYTDAAGNQYLVNYTATDPNAPASAMGNDVSLTVVPEPGGLALLAGGAGCLALWRRAARRKTVAGM